MKRIYTADTLSEKILEKELEVQNQDKLLKEQLNAFSEHIKPMNIVKRFLGIPTEDEIKKKAEEALKKTNEVETKKEYKATLMNTAGAFTQKLAKQLFSTKPETISLFGKLILSKIQTKKEVKEE